MCCEPSVCYEKNGNMCVCGFATRRPAFVTPLPHPFVLPLHINWYAKAVGDDEVYHDNTQGVVDCLGRVDYLRSWLFPRGSVAIASWHHGCVDCWYRSAKVETTQYIRFQYARRH